MSALAPHHAEFLAARAVSPEVAELRGYRTITHPVDLVLAGGFPPGQATKLGTGMLIPRYGLDGRPSWAKFRPDGVRRRADGTPIKYASPAGSWNLVDCLPARRLELLDAPEIWVSAEGYIKGDSMTTAGLSPVLAVDGVWGWRGSEGPLPAWRVLSTQPRWWHVVADNDLAANDDVAIAAFRLGAYLQGLGAKGVRILHPPVGRKKVGIDDHLAQGGTLDELVQVPAATVRRVLTSRPERLVRAYSPVLTAGVV